MDLPAKSPRPEWINRVNALRLIPRQARHPQEALEKIEALRQNTRDGDDLYFLEVAAQLTAIRWPEYDSLVKELRTRFFDHIPPPPIGLFENFELSSGSRCDFWREIPAGKFLMGTAAPHGQRDERPCQEVEIDEPFLISSTPVVNAQYLAFSPDHGVAAWSNVSEAELANHPAAGVSWHQASSFCRWLSGSFGGHLRVRLPTEVEWEYACRAGSSTMYWPGDTEQDLASVGWFRENSGGRTHRVGEKPENPWGLFDVHGNVREWTSNGYTPRLFSPNPQQETLSPLLQPEHHFEGYGRVLRGGGYWDLAPFTRSAIRCLRLSGVHFLSVGFRVVMS